MQARSSHQTAPTSTDDRMQSLAGKYLTFLLGGEEYALHILHVREIVGLLPITPIPRTLDYLLGVVNLRGKVIPVVDLRRRLSMRARAATPETCIIFLELPAAESNAIVGVVVDEVADVRDFQASALEPAPELGSNIDNRFFLGIAKHAERVVLILDFQRALCADELNAATEQVPVEPRA